jgi:hypothetical protein
MEHGDPLLALRGAADVEAKQLARRAVGRIGELIALSAALVTFFFAGTYVNSWNKHQGIATIPIPPPAHVSDPYNDAYRTEKLAPLPDVSRPTDPRKPEPQAVKSRAEAIRLAAAALRADCRTAAGGDWEKWQRDTKPYRVALKDKIDAIMSSEHPEKNRNNAVYQILEGRDRFPLFEVNARRFLSYLYVPATLDSFRRDRPVVAADRWLKQRGIDLIFVPLPKMTELYIDRFLDHLPPDGIVAPHTRRTLLELLEADVEVVDALRLFRSVRDVDSEYLYNSADPHWAPRAMRVMAEEIASRIRRYRFGTRARFGLPIVQARPGPYVFRDTCGVENGFGWRLLEADQKELAERAQSKTQAVVQTLEGKPPPDDPDSPVVIIGHSYVPRFREQLIKELNLLTCMRASDHQTTESFADFLREPELLGHARVVVWITTDFHMTRFQPLPEPILAVLKTSK